MIAFVINLPHREDRHKEIMDVCKKAQIYPIVFYGVNGREVYPDKPKMMRGHLGCRASHLLLLKSLLERHSDYFIVMEDDCELVDGFKEKLEAAMNELPVYWDLMYFGGHLKGEQVKHSDNLIVAKDVLCTHGYVIKKDSIKGLIKAIEAREDKIDLLFRDFQQKANCFMTWPVLSWQRTSHSDIEYTTTSNDHLR